MTELVRAQDLKLQFDISKPLLNRVIEGAPRRILTAVDGVSFDIAPGQTFALVGESGAGKSTIGRMLVGLLPPTDGQATIGGVDLFHHADASAKRAVRQRIQMVFQDPFASLNPRWRIGNLIAEPIEQFGLLDSKQAISNRVDELLEMVGLSPADRRKYPHEFSGGQRQRICIARALASEPEFIVLDEPTSALDVSVQSQVLNLLKDLQTELNLAYLFITHDLSVVRFVADQIGVLYLGRLVEVAEKQKLFSAPVHPYTQMLLESAPRLDAFGRERSAIEGEIPDPANRPSGCHYHPRCPYATEKCRTETPELKYQNSGALACFGYDAGGAG